jgi:hypothetical protein
VEQEWWLNNLIKIVAIPNVLSLVAFCWVVAERNVQQQVKHAPDSDEDFITKLFHLEFSKQLQEASENYSISQAFLKDLKSGLPDVDVNFLNKRYQGLVAEVRLHKPKREKITGGDLGILFLRPRVIYSAPTVTIKDYRRGLLVQAKMKRKTGKWGQFSRKQRSVLPERCGYLGLLLYQFCDPERRQLSPFVWQLCSRMSFVEIEKCLNQDAFPNLIDSTRIVQELGQAAIGTDDDETIDKIISTARNPCLTIRLHWPSDKKPPPRSIVQVSVNRSRAQQQVRIRH